MHSGLRNKMQEQITKMSPTLGRDAVYTKTVKNIIQYKLLCFKSLIFPFNKDNIFYSQKLADCQHI